MKYSNPVKKEYNGKLYEFRNITNDDGSRIVVKIDRNQADVRMVTNFNKECMRVDLHKFNDISEIHQVIRSIERKIGRCKPLFYKGLLYFNKVNKDFNAIHFKAVSSHNGINKIIVDPITV